MGDWNDGAVRKFVGDVTEARGAVARLQLIDWERAPVAQGIEHPPPKPTTIVACSCLS
jgi:hypothetical protein